MSRKPNILYIFTDQQGADAMSCAGNPYLSTPAMDRLADNGVRFTNAYCSYPLCVPSRMSMVTGRMPHELDIYANCHETENPCGVPTIGTLCRDAGYETSWIGKWHLTILEANHRRHGFDEVILGGGYGDKDSKKTEETLKLFERDHDEPFLLVLSLNNPHDCCELSRGQDLRMGDIPAPPAVDELPPLPGNYDIPAQELDAQRGFARDYPRSFPADRWTELQARQYLWGYYRLVEMVDREIGQVLDGLEQAGLVDDTLIIFSSDHGDGMSRHRWNQKWSLYDESAKVPFIVTGNPVEKSGVADDSLVSAGLDLLPTICDYAGIDIPAGVCGRSVRGLVEGTESNWREYVVSELSLSMWADVGEDGWPKGRMVRTQTQKYVSYDAGEVREQFTDLVADSGEMANLASDDRFVADVNRHRAYLREWCASTGDRYDSSGTQSS